MGLPCSGHSCGGQRQPVLSPCGQRQEPFCSICFGFGHQLWEVARYPHSRGSRVEWSHQGKRLHLKSRSGHPCYMTVCAAHRGPRTGWPEPRVALDLLGIRSHPTYLGVKGTRFFRLPARAASAEWGPWEPGPHVGSGRRPAESYTVGPQAPALSSPARVPMLVTVGDAALRCAWSCG